jgi:hypothetical protein
MLCVSGLGVTGSEGGVRAPRPISVGSSTAGERDGHSDVHNPTGITRRCR